MLGNCCDRPEIVEPFQTLANQHLKDFLAITHCFKANSIRRSFNTAKKEAAKAAA
jgi:hypothetical protein